MLSFLRMPVSGCSWSGASKTFTLESVLFSAVLPNETSPTLLAKEGFYGLPCQGEVRRGGEFLRRLRLWYRMKM